MIQVGDSIPAVEITVIDAEGQKTVSVAEFFSGKKAVLFGLPGAFTPGCSESHMPGFVANADAIHAKGVDVIACLSVNDSFVMKAWQKAQGAEQIAMIADGNAELTKALDLVLETGSFGGTRSKRYSMIVEQGKVTQINVEPEGAVTISDANTVLSQL